MNIIFIGETDIRGFSIYLDQKTAKKRSYIKTRPEGLYIYYYEGLVKHVGPPSDEPLPGIFI
jgi:hypothetical protein